MPNEKQDTLSTVNFHCSVCKYRFKAEPVVEDAPEQGWHPWRYTAKCPECDDVAEQAAWELNLLKAHSLATGPKTPEGKAASAKNLEGHPTPEEAKRTRFNAITHANTAKTARYCPAKPGKYVECEGCEYLEDEACKPHGACLKRIELFMKYQLAFENRDPSLLTEIHSENQAAIQVILSRMLLHIMHDGAELIAPKINHHPDLGSTPLKYMGDDGKEHFINEITAHPLLKPMMELLSKNNLSLADLVMTPKVQDDTDLLKGFLDNSTENKETTSEFQQQMLEKTSALQRLIESPIKNEDGTTTIDGEVERLD